MVMYKSKTEKHTTIKVSDSVRRELKLLAALQDMTMMETISCLVKEALEKRGEKIAT